MDEKRQWIKADEDHVPNTGVKVMVYTNRGQYRYATLHYNYDKSGQYWTGYSDSGRHISVSNIPSDEVTHWQPLPSPPELSES